MRDYHNDALRAYVDLRSCIAMHGDAKSFRCHAIHTHPTRPPPSHTSIHNINLNWMPFVHIFCLPFIRSFVTFPFQLRHFAFALSQPMCVTRNSMMIFQTHTHTRARVQYLYHPLEYLLVIHNLPLLSLSSSSLLWLTVAVTYILFRL